MKASKSLERLELSWFTGNEEIPNDWITVLQEHDGSIAVMTILKKNTMGGKKLCWTNLTLTFDPEQDTEG